MIVLVRIPDHDWLFGTFHPLSQNLTRSIELGTDDFHKILATMPNLTRLNLRFVTPMKDRIFQYMMDRDMNIQDLHLDSPNLVTDEVWRQLFTRLGPRLRSLKLWNLDSAFDDEASSDFEPVKVRKFSLPYRTSTDVLLKPAAAAKKAAVPAAAIVKGLVAIARPRDCVPTSSPVSVS